MFQFPLEVCPMTRLQRFKSELGASHLCQEKRVFYPKKSQFWIDALLDHKREHVITSESMHTRAIAITGNQVAVSNFFILLKIFFKKVILQKRSQSGFCRGRSFFVWNRLLLS